MATATKILNEWLIFLGQPTENDLNWLFDEEITAYVLAEFSFGGEC